MLVCKISLVKYAWLKIKEIILAVNILVDVSM